MKQSSRQIVLGVAVMVMSMTLSNAWQIMIQIVAGATLLSISLFNLRRELEK